MITGKTIPAGTNWVQSNKTNGSAYSLHIISTGRIIMGSTGIWYSDDNGVNWVKSNKTNGFTYSLCITPTGRIIAGGSEGIWYSDDNGVNWVQSNKTYGSWKALCVTPTGRIIAGSDDNISDGIWYSDDNGVNWTPSNNKPASSCNSLYVTSTERIIAASSAGIWYSDDNGVNWIKFNGTLGNYETVYVTSSGIITVGYYYSNDNGTTWTKATGVTSCNSICATPTGRLIAGSSTKGIWYSDIENQSKYSSKPLTGKQAKELVRQCKAYVQELKNRS